MARSRDFYTSVNGVSGFVPPRRDQASRIYNAESIWAKHASPRANQSISEQGAKDMMGEIINHKALDNFPDIHHLRQGWDPEEHVTFDETTRGLGQTDNEGYVNIHPDHLRTHVVTHETAHLAHLLGHQFQDHEGTPGGFDHEWPFANTHLHIVHNTLGKEDSRSLRDQYRMFHVQWMPKHKG